jgi:hypothetical protein
MVWRLSVVVVAEIAPAWSKRAKINGKLRRE